MNKFSSTKFNTKALCDENRIESTNENDDIISLIINFTNAILISLSDIVKSKNNDLN